MTTLTVHWEHESGDPSRVIYFADGRPVGEGSSGFDKILTLLRSKTDAQLVLKISSLSVGGNRLEDSFPFGERYDELVEAVGKGRITHVFF